MNMVLCEYIKDVGFNDYFDDIPTIQMQRGPIKDFGINGFREEHLLAIVIDRLSSSEEAGLGCKENKLAIDNIKSALEWLNQRTIDRETRKVEGALVP